MNRATVLRVTAKLTSIGCCMFSKRSHGGRVTGRIDVTQTNSMNPLEKPIVSGGEKIGSRSTSHFHEGDENQTQSGRWVKPKRKLIPEAKLRQPSREAVAIEAAKGRIDRDFYAMENHIYAKFVENISPELLELAAKEDVRFKGRGMRLIHAELIIESARSDKPDPRLKKCHKRCHGRSL